MLYSTVFEGYETHHQTAVILSFLGETPFFFLSFLSIGIVTNVVAIIGQSAR